jgi:gliding motility-associated-like protein
VQFKLVAYNTLFITIVCLPLFALAQGVGRTIINVNFGEGRTNPGLPLSPNNTSFNFSPDSCATPGSYTVTNNLYRCPANRMGRSIDNTPGSNYGYMMVVNDTPSSKSRILYVDTLKEVLCNGTQYEFSAYLLNTAVPGYCSTDNIHHPRFTFKVETTTGMLIQSSNTGLMPYDYSSGGAVPKFHFYSVDFYPPAGVNDLVLKIEDDPSGYTPCGYTFAIDDIKFTALGPEADAQFSDAIGVGLVRNICYQENKTIHMSGSVKAFYPNTSLQWQQSVDSGLTWTDIPGATSATYSKLFATPDTFLFRLSASDVSTISNPNCRVVSNVLKVNVNDKPTDYTATSNSPVCVGSILQFNATGGMAYEWFGPNGYYDNVYYAHIYTTTLADSGWYYVDVISQGGCRAHDSLYVKIIDANVHVSVSSDTSICEGSSIQLNANSNANSYYWSPPEGLSDPTVSNPVVTPKVTTTYTVKVNIQAACTDSATVRVKILNPQGIQAKIQGPDYLCRPYDSVSFRARSEGSVAKWNWIFGNGKSDTSAKPPVQYYSINNNDLNYTVRLIVADAMGCSDTAYHLIKVVDNCYIAVPTAFTPNGDGLNDYLYPLNAYKATNLSFRVYNRSGRVVFETKDWTKKWDGKLNGIPQATGVYVWMLEYNDERGKKISLKGTTVLIR